MDKDIKYNIYVLLLENNKYYVGKTIDNLDDCIKKHMKKPNIWLNINKPIEIIESIKSQPIEIEEKVTLKYMKLYGIDNVRNSIYNDIILAPIMIKKLDQYKSDDSVLSIDVQYIKSQIKSIDTYTQINILLSEVNRLEQIIKSIDKLNTTIFRNSIISYSDLDSYNSKYTSIHSILSINVEESIEPTNTYIIDLISKYEYMKANSKYFHKIDYIHMKILDDIYHSINTKDTHRSNISRYDKSLYINLLKIINTDIDNRYNLYNLIKTECSKYNYNIQLVDNMHLIDLNKVYDDSLLYLTTYKLYNIIIKKNQYFLEEIYKLKMINKTESSTFLPDENVNLPPPYVRVKDI